MIRSATGFMVRGILTLIFILMDMVGAAIGMVTTTDTGMVITMVTGMDIMQVADIRTIITILIIITATITTVTTALAVHRVPIIILLLLQETPMAIILNLLARSMKQQWHWKRKVFLLCLHRVRAK